MSEYLLSPTTKVGRFTASTFKDKELKYSVIGSVIGDLAIFEGDIVLGTAAQVAEDSAKPEVMTVKPEGIGISDPRFRWPGGKIPYLIDGNLLNPERVTGAIAHWEANTGIRFILLSSGSGDYIHFIDGGGCWSQVGRRGGKQELSLGFGCTLGNAIHEIGHSVGLWHEQSREDRDRFVTINAQNIQPGMEHNFDQHIQDGDDIGAYDYGSIMHYPAWAFSVNGLPTIVSNDGTPIGQRDGLSPGDIAAIKAMYANI